MISSRLGAALATAALVVAACASGAGPPAATTAGELSPLTSRPWETVPLPEPPPDPPDVDLTVHSVPLDAIYFDTFDGGAVPLSRSTAELRARLLDIIPPIDAPRYDSVSDAGWLEPSDLVLGYVAADGQAFAYPFKILNFHEIVNDVIDDVPVLVSYCPLCRSGVVYDRRLGGDVLSFGNTSALYESDMVMVDRTTGSYWWQVSGTAIVGRLTGATLEPLPSAVATWEGWVEAYPGTAVLSRDTGHRRPYEIDGFDDYAERIDGGRFPFPVSSAVHDDRLPPSSLVLAVEFAAGAVGYRVDGLDHPINDDVGDLPIVVMPLPGGAAAFRATLDGQPLDFERVGVEVTDVQTGSVWDATGRAVAGELAGRRLEPLPARTAFWFAVIAAFPEIDLRTG